MLAISRDSGILLGALPGCVSAFAVFVSGAFVPDVLRRENETSVSVSESYHATRQGAWNAQATPVRGSDSLMSKYLEKARRVRLMRALADGAGWVCHYCLADLVPPGEEEKHCTALFLPEGPNNELVKSYAYPSGVFWPTLDHKLPRSRGGTHALENLVLACPSCNTDRGARYTYEEYFELTRPKREKGGGL